jgi:hypothetical protein
VYEIAVRAGSARVRTSVSSARRSYPIAPRSRYPRSNTHITTHHALHCIMPHLRLGEIPRSGSGVPLVCFQLYHFESSLQFTNTYPKAWELLQSPVCCLSNTQIDGSSNFFSFPCLGLSSWALLGVGPRPIVVRIVCPSACGSQAQPPKRQVKTSLHPIVFAPYRTEPRVQINKYLFI